MNKEDVVHTYNDYYSAMKKNDIPQIDAAWMGIEIAIIRKVSKKTNTI